MKVRGGGKERELSFDFTDAAVRPPLVIDLAGFGRCDEVTVTSEHMGTLRNRVTTTDRAAPWTFGVADLMYSLAARGLLGERAL